jgi:hypothetical protein
MSVTDLRRCHRLSHNVIHQPHMRRGIGDRAAYAQQQHSRGQQQIRVVMRIEDDLRQQWQYIVIHCQVGWIEGREVEMLWRTIINSFYSVALRVSCNCSYC